MMTLFKQCVRCAGTGTAYFGADDMGDCTTCEGTGVVPLDDPYRQDDGSVAVPMLNGDVWWFVASDTRPGTVWIKVERLRETTVDVWLPVEAIEHVAAALLSVARP